MEGVSKIWDRYPPRVGGAWLAPIEIRPGVLIYRIWLL